MLHPLCNTYVAAAITSYWKPVMFMAAMKPDQNAKVTNDDYEIYLLKSLLNFFVRCCNSLTCFETFRGLSPTSASSMMFTITYEELYNRLVTEHVCVGGRALDKLFTSY